MDARLNDFAAVRAGGAPSTAGDLAFDVDASLEQAIEAQVRPAAHIPIARDDA
jgi:hypothetical protein